MRTLRVTPERSVWEGKTFLAAVKAIDKALEIAKAAADDAMVRALEAGRAPLSAHIVEMGIRLPDAKARGRGRRKKTEAA